MNDVLLGPPNRDVSTETKNQKGRTAASGPDPAVNLTLVPGTAPQLLRQPLINQLASPIPCPAQAQ